MHTINIHKHKLDSFYLLSKFPDHDNLKDQLLDTITKSEQKYVHNKDNIYADSITKVDWQFAKDLSREWVLLIYDAINNYYSFAANMMGYESSVIQEIWFQQYYNKDTHGWHTHGNNFTSVYYLELNDESPRTELIDPFSCNKKIIPNVKEGDIIIFPSYVMHRAPVIDNNIRKTIISCNIDFNNPHIDIVPHLNAL